jgi:nucleoside phosphorylase
VTEKEKEDLRCNVLILVTTSSEREALKTAAKEAGLPFQRHTVPSVDQYYNLGTVGNAKVNAARTEMGPLGHQGSAARAMTLTEKALDLHIATAATGIIQLGMAFGVDPISQHFGDVLVSTSLIPYDNRDVVAEDTENVALPSEGDALTDHEVATDESPDAVANVEHIQTAPTRINAPSPPRPESDRPYKTDYARAERRYAKQSLLEMLRREANRGAYGHRIYFGGLLSGGARIFSRRFLKELVNGVPQAEDGIIGGDMEGVGLLSVSPPDAPIWIVVKAISDFADEERGNVKMDDAGRKVFEEKRRVACLNSARFVLRALANAELE